MSKDKEYKYEECAYCGREIPTDGRDPVPAIDDDEAWVQEATLHSPECEWVATRAHRKYDEFDR